VERLPRYTGKRRAADNAEHDQSARLTHVDASPCSGSV